MRTEKDSMGSMVVPDDAYYGAQTQRAVENFPISGIYMPPAVIRALGIIKRSAAVVNADLKQLDDERKSVIIKAAEEVIDGNFDNQFLIDIFQTGSGTSSNMNTNEIIANRASELMGGTIGSREPVHPNDHVNMGQSSNDVIPTAIHIAAKIEIENELIPALEMLHRGLDEKAKAWDHIVKIGRTHLQDATPIRLGQEFSGYAAMIRSGIKRLELAKDQLEGLAQGGTAVGTGINTHVEFGARIAKEVSSYTGVVFSEAVNHYEAQATQDAAVLVSGVLKTVAVSFFKIANDIRWLGSGPRAGLGELILPPVQPGSSIMPGKVNPVICESLIQISAQVVGNDAAITLGGLGGVFELNLMLPLIAHNLLQSIEIMSNGAKMFNEKLLTGLEVDTQKCADYIEGSLAMCTSLAPVIGYDNAAAIAHDAYESGKTVRQIALEKKVLDEAQLNELLDPLSMTNPNK
ncbi:MAG: class II fumarate hydratase [Candidatus Marinimicrobia bacterium]|jgi:fumarate hydratase class II|nr:class II fumarate hydratase [Candidatus Neomarinimicrobiota bacterium]MBT3633881.1 class II fumarate hydratase [Candidatus Neomarinimicrobiota bacterium]MBT3682869.1 class II fumarate hydratase [Candidatus Neomarinimicrobiota bacterium]MBT3759944.1 class II fumarate hydratase [Candidatus Neomarinimicrobiota bacterium]MBT3896038.1 class II fumarate hydratase [Candidatus Neomarinimicrobiota bacterium]